MGDPFGANRWGGGRGGRFILPIDFYVLVCFWQLLKKILKEHLNIGKNAKEQPHIFKNKKIWAFEFFGKSWFIINFSNLFSEISDFSCLKINKNKTDDQTPLKPFLSDRGDHNIKSQEALGYNNSPTLNIRAKTKKEDKSAPLPQIGLITSNIMYTI